MTSKFPNERDLRPPDLSGGRDIVTDDVLEHTASMVFKAQVALGTRPADLSALAGGLDFGNVADALLHLSRVEAGTYGPVTINSWSELDGFRVGLTTDRFTAPPVVRIQQSQPRHATNNWTYPFEPRLVTETAFGIVCRLQGSAAAPALPFTLEFDWVAMQAPFGEQGGYPV